MGEDVGLGIGISSVELVVENFGSPEGALLGQCRRSAHPFGLETVQFLVVRAVYRFQRVHLWR